jgi:hypothetical protein
VAEVAASVRERLGMTEAAAASGGGAGGDPAASLPAAAALARLYVPDPVARSGLWEPVKAAVRDAVSQARGLIDAEYGSSGGGGGGEGEEEENVSIDLPSDAEVAAALARVLV